MKKPRKPKPKAKRRAPSSAAAPRRALAPAAHTRHRSRARRRNTLGTIRHRISALAVSGAASARRGFAELAALAERVQEEDLRARFGNWRAASEAIALPYSRDERQILLLLFLPVLLVASAIVVHQSMRTLYDYVTLAATHGPEQEIAAIRPDTAAKDPPPVAELPKSSPRAPIARETMMPSTPVHALASTPETEVSGPAAPTIPSVFGAPQTEARPVTAATSLPPARDPLVPLPKAGAPAAATPPAEPLTTLALLNPAPTAGLRQPLVVPAPIEAFEADDTGQPIFPGICTVADAARNAPITTGALPVSTAAAVSLSPEALGLRLAEAAEAQTTGFVVYNDAYRSIAYPMGDVHQMFGVCTDVVIRAYRALGIDLQALVHQTRSGRGDRNIDHRRTEVLRRFFATHGESLPVSSFAEDYRPGDIVTYHRPQNRGSRSHIAVVSSKIAPSGRPMIVHNRGWGPQLEDALFVDRITGHYRYRGPEGVQQDASVERASPQSVTRRISGARAASTTGIAAAAIPISLPGPAN